MTQSGHLVLRIVATQNDGRTPFSSLLFRLASIFDPHQVRRLAPQTTVNERAPFDLHYGETIMSAKLPFPDRRKILAASVAVAASSLIPPQVHAATTSEAIRPFHVNFPRAELSESRRRIKTTRWPDRET